MFQPFEKFVCRLLAVSVNQLMKIYLINRKLFEAKGRPHRSCF